MSMFFMQRQLCRHSSMKMYVSHHSNVIDRCS